MASSAYHFSHPHFGSIGRLEFARLILDRQNQALNLTAKLRMQPQSPRLLHVAH